jgi:Skp family chaperone for outer membrane proteins
MKHWLFKHRAMVAFIALAIATIIALNSSAKHTAQSAARINYQSAVASCHRGNTLRVSINSDLNQAARTEALMVRFMTDAAGARKATYESTHLPADGRAYHQYATLATHARRRIHFKPLAQVNCGHSILKP